MADIIRYRPGTFADLEECLPFCRDEFAYDPPLRQALLRWWCERLSAGNGFMPVIENCAAPPGRRILFFAFLVFITDEFAEYLVKGAPPFLMASLLRDRHRLESAFLLLETIRRRNADRTLTMLCANSGARVFLDRAADYADITAKIVQFQTYAVGGYGLKSVLIEFYGEAQWTYAEGFGNRLRTDYAAYYRARPELAPRCLDETPRLYGSTAEEIAKQLGSGASQWFEYRAPKYRFSSTEQELLLNALTFDTDEELAQQLSLSTAAVRKRWQAVYDEVDRVEWANAVAGDGASKAAGDKHKQRKRQILNYVRFHISELRPLPTDR